MATVTFYFDCSSPWTYLAFVRLQPMAERLGARIDWKPFLVGGVFNAVNQEMYETRANQNPLKKSYYLDDLQQWAEYCGIMIGWPEVFPVRAVDPMRAVIVAEDEGKHVALAKLLFERYWGDLQDISDHAVLGSVIAEAGLDPEHVLARIKDQDVKDRLKANTEELIARRGFGSPTMFVGDEMFFGNDRLPLVERALERAGRG